MKHGEPVGGSIAKLINVIAKSVCIGLQRSASVGIGLRSVCGWSALVSCLSVVGLIRKLVCL